MQVFGETHGKPTIYMGYSPLSLMIQSVLPISAVFPFLQAPSSAETSFWMLFPTTRRAGSKASRKVPRGR